MQKHQEDLIKQDQERFEKFYKKLVEETDLIAKLLELTSKCLEDINILLNKENNR